MIRRMMALFITFAFLLFSIGSITMVYADEVNNDTDGSVTFKGYEFHSYEPGEDDAKLYEEAGALIYEIDKISLADWQNKVFIEKDVVLEKGKQYTVDFTISANKDTYFTFFVNPKGGWNPVISQTLNTGDYDESYRFTTSVMDVDTDMEVLFQFGGGGNQAPLKISFLDFSIYEGAGVQGTKNTANYKVADFNGFSVTGEGSNDGKLYIEGSWLVFETSEAGRVKIEDLSFKKGCDYEIEYTIWADKKVQAACSIDPKGGYFMPGEQLISLSKEPQRISHRTGIQQADRQMEITFDISKTTNGELTKIVFDEIVVREIKDGQKKNLRNAWVLDGFPLTHDESGGAIADFNIDENGDIVYKIEKIGENDWNNKVAINRGVTFVKDSAYRVAISLEADKEMQFFFGVNPKNKWEPKVSEVLWLKQGVNDFLFVTDTQAYDESMEVLFQFGGFGNTAPCDIKIKAISMEAADADESAAIAVAAAADPVVVKNYNFSTSDGYKFKGFVMNDSSGSELYLEQGVLVYDIKTFGVNQLIKKDLWLGVNCAYSVEMRVSANRQMNVDCFVSGKNTQREMEKTTFTVGKNVEVIQAEFRTGDNTEDQGRIVFDLSNNEGSGKFYVHAVIIKAIENGMEETFSMDLFDVATDRKSNATAAVVDGGLKYSIKRFGGNPWENKISVNNIMEFKKDKTYLVDFDIRSTEDLVFICVLRDLERTEDEDEQEHFWERNRIGNIEGGEKQHFRYKFKASEDNRINEMVFEFGGQGNTKKGPVDIFISDVTITECTDYRTDTLRFPEAQGMFSYEHEGSLASASLYQKNDVLVYEIDRQGILDWHNKIIFNQGIKFAKGYRYRIDVTASANMGTNLKFTVVSQEDWEEKVKKYKFLSTTESTLSFETDSIQHADEYVEFSLDFGGMYNRDGTIVAISDIKIYRLSPGTLCQDTAIDDYDLEIEYDDSDFYESTSFQGYTFNSTLIDDADASLYEQNGILHYEIKEVGAETYYNKLSINDEITVKADKSYKIEITARADKALNFFCAVNEAGGDWNPLVAETVTLSDVSTTYTFITTPQDMDKVVELILEFGANGNIAPNHVYIEEFKISEMNIVDESPVTFKGNVFTHEETGGTAKGVLYTNDNGNMVYYAQKLGNIPGDNTVSTTATMTGGQDSEIKLTLKPQKGMLVNISVMNVVTGEKLKATTVWAGDHETKEIILSVAAQPSDTDIEIAVMFGQEEYADERENNNIEFLDFSITESDEIVDAGTVTLNGYTFSHAESGDVAKGSLYNDDDGNMVYYAEKLGNVDWHNKIIGTDIDVEEGAEYTLTVEVELEKGLDMVTYIPEARNTDNGGDAWYRNWLSSDASNTLTFRITAQSDTLEIFFQVGQENYADGREDNHIVFKSISLRKESNEEVTLNGYTFSHAESGDVAKGRLYNDGDGNMVYHAEKLGNADWHNKVIGTDIDVEEDAEYTLTVEVALEKGLDMVTYIPEATNTDNGADAWYRNWLSPDASNTLTFRITAQSDTLEIFFQVGQENYADGREDNHIVFKSISLRKENDGESRSLINSLMPEIEEEPEDVTVPNEENSDESENSDEEIKQEQEQEQEQEQQEQQEESAMNDIALETDEGADVTVPDEEDLEESENNDAETKQEQQQEGSGMNNDAILESEKRDEDEDTTV